MAAKKKETKTETHFTSGADVQKQEKNEEHSQTNLPALEKKVEDLVDWMISHPAEVIKERQELQEKMVKKRCIYGESLIPTTLIPLFLKKESLELIEKTSSIIDRVIDKAINLYFVDEKVRDYFPYPQLPKKWIDADPGYSKPTVINRHDIIFDGKELKFIEFNTDNPGGRGWTDTYEELFLRQPLYKDLIESFGRPLERKVLNGHNEAILACFKEMGLEEKPRVGFVDFREISCKTDSEIVRDYFIEHGIEANLIDARDFELRDGKLWSNGVCFNLIVRALKAEYYMRFPKEVQDFIRAVTSKNVCMVNSFRATLGSEKAILSFISNPFNHHYFSDEEAEVIKKHVPWTRKLDETITLSPEGEEINLKSFMKKNKDRLVLKPSWGAGGYRVMVGKVTERGDWEDCVEDNIGCPWWVVQDKVNIPKGEFPVIKQNKIVMEERFLNLSPYVFGGKYVGILGRTSTKDVINVSAGGGVIPVFPMKS